MNRNKYDSPYSSAVKKPGSDEPTKYANEYIGKEKKNLELKQKELDIKTRLVGAMMNRDKVANEMKTVEREIASLKEKIYHS